MELSCKEGSPLKAHVIIRLVNAIPKADAKNENTEYLVLGLLKIVLSKFCKNSIETEKGKLAAALLQAVAAHHQIWNAHRQTFLDELKQLKGNRLKSKSKKSQDLKLSMAESTTVANLEHVINLHKVPIKIEYPSTSELIKFESEANPLPTKRSRGRPRLDFPKTKVVPDIKINCERTGKRRGRPSKSKMYDGRTLNCGLCDFKAEDLYDLEGHLKLHANQTVYECRFCNSTFSQKGNLITHIRTHTKEKPFKCLFCDFAASQKVNLQVHIRTHTKEKPFKCSMCDFSTAQKCNLVAHITRRHSNVEVVKSLESYDNQWGSNETQLKYYRCGTCLYSCRLKREMIDHIKIQHPYSTCDYQTIDVLK